MQMCASSNSSTSTESLGSSPGCCLLTTRNCFRVSRWIMLISDRLTTVLVLPIHTEVDRWPIRCLAPLHCRGRSLNLLTGQMSGTWQNSHPDSPAEILQTGSLPEVKMIFLFLSLIQTLALFLSVFTWLGPLLIAHTVKRGRQTGGRDTDH